MDPLWHSVCLNEYAGVCVSIYCLLVSICCQFICIQSQPFFDPPFIPISDSRKMQQANIEERDYYAILGLPRTVRLGVLMEVRRRQTRLSRNIDCSQNSSILINNPGNSRSMRMNSSIELTVPTKSSVTRSGGTCTTAMVKRKGMRVERNR